MGTREPIVTGSAGRGRVTFAFQRQGIRARHLHPRRPRQRTVNRNVEPIRQALSVPLDPERAFDLFTARMDTWWPLDQYSRVVNEHLGGDTLVTGLEFQGEMGGSILEHTSDGNVLPWGQVVGWDPPREVRMSWRPHSEPELPTEVAVTFRASEDGTLIELEHRGWERLSERFREAMYEIYVRGWVTTLGHYSAAAERL